MKPKNELKYALKVSERQLDVIREALDLFHRLLDGHIEESLKTLFMSRELDYDEFSEICGKLKKLVFPELFPNGYYSVGWYAGSPQRQMMQIAYEIEAKIRHEKWKRNPNAPRHITSASPPLRYSAEPFVELEDIKN